VAWQSAQPLPLGGVVGSTPGNVLTLAPILAASPAPHRLLGTTIGSIRSWPAPGPHG